MWYLVGKQNGNTIYLLTNKKYKVGRLIDGQTCDIDVPISSDLSISRLHAEILIKYEENDCTNIDSKPNVILTDYSKFGTFVNDVKVDGFKALKPSDSIRFGVYKSVYELCHEPTIITTSCLNNQNKSIVRGLICKLGGHIVNDWRNECSFVVMDSVTVTVKVVDALIGQKRVVSQDYLKELVRAVENQKELPDPKNFLPPIAEESLKFKKLNFEPLVVRKTLFKNKTFIFFDPIQLQKIQNIIESASGKCELFNHLTHLDNKILRSNRENFLFIQNNDLKSKTLKDYQSRLEILLKNLNQNLIEESEIGLAILFADLKDNCNPNKSTSSEASKLKSLPDTYFSSDSMIPNGFEDTMNRSGKKRIQDIFDIDDGSTQIEQTAANNDPVDVMIVCDSPPPRTESLVTGIKPDKSNTVIVKSMHKKLSNDESPPKSEPTRRETRSTRQKDTKSSDTSVTTSSRRLGVGIRTNVDKTETSASLTKANHKSSHSVCKEDLSMKSVETQELSAKLPNKVERSLQIEPLGGLNEHNETKPKGLKHSSLNSSHVVYSKNKPPPESVIKKEEASLNESISEIKVSVKFEPLVTKKLLTKTEHEPNSNQKPNFKKFKKIPKSIGRVSQAETSIFRSIKKENFNVDTQFHEFMSSMR